MHLALVRAARSFTKSSSEAEDVVQAAFVRLYEKRPKLASIAELHAWLHVVARRLAFDDLRRAARRRAASIDPATLASPALDATPRWLDLTPEDVQRAIGRCDTRSRSLLELHHIRRFSYATLAVIAEIPAGTVASRLHRARQRARSHLMQQLGDA